MHMLRSVDRRQIAMDFCCKGANPGEMAAEACALGAEVHHCQLLVPGVPFGIRFGRLIRTGKYDLVHVHTGIFSGTPSRIARASGAAVIASFHNVNFAPQKRSRTAWPVAWVRNAYARWSLQQAYRHANLITGCSQAVLEALGTTFSAGGPTREAVMRYGVPHLKMPSQEEMESARAELGISPRDRVVLSIGSLRAQKNHQAVVRIARRVCSTLPNARFLIVGDGPLRAQLTSQIEDANAGTEVRLAGKRSDIALLLAISDILLFPSKWEGFGIVALEAQMCRVPVIGSDIGALHEATVVNKSSLLFDVEDEAGMGDAIIELLLNEERRRYMGEQGSQFVDDNYSLASSVESLQALYRDVVTGNHGAESSRAV